MSDSIRLARGLHRPADEIADLAARCAAFLEIAPPGTVIGGVTAARLHDLWLPAPRPDERIELVLTRDGIRPEDLAGTRRKEIRLRRRMYRPDEITMVGGLPLSTEGRTWIDEAEHLRIEDLVALGDCVLKGQTDLDELTELVHAATHRRGVRRACEALPLLNSRSRSRPRAIYARFSSAAACPYPR